MEREDPKKYDISGPIPTPYHSHLERSWKKRAKNKGVEDPLDSKKSPSSSFVVSIIDEANCAKYPVECMKNDTVWDLKVKINDLKGVSMKRQRLFHHGYELLKDAVWLVDYKIMPDAFIDLFIVGLDGHGDSRVPQDVADSTDFVLPEDEGEPQHSEDDFESNLFSMSESAATERIQFWHHKARLGNYDADTHIVDPLAHYDHLNYLEKYVIEHSEFFRCKGRYDPEDQAYFNEKGASGIPDEMWKIVEEHFVQMPNSRSDKTPNLIDKITKEAPQIAAKDAMSLRKSYTLLCNILTSFGHLQEGYFCTNFFSMLVQKPGRSDIARLVEISEQRLQDWKMHVETAVRIITASREEIFLGLDKLIGHKCEAFFHSINLPLGLEIQGQSRTFIIETFRVTVLLLDLALVAYVGSHGSRFSERHIGVESEGFGIVSFEKSLPPFACSHRPLDCLREFLDEEKVWVFGFEKDRLISQSLDEPPKLSILTRIDTFADVWGPVWGLSAGNKFSNDVFQQYNLSRGFIYPVPGSPNGSTGGMDIVVCHWDQFLPIFSEDSFQKKRYLKRTDLLLIGANLWHNNQCRYRLSHYDDDYGAGLAALGTARPEWRPETWTVGVTAGQYVAVNANVARKKYPGTTLKENIWAKFKHDPEDASIEYLNHFLGVEISHCSGNAKRVKLKDLFLIRRIKSRLNAYKPNWASTHWGQLFSEALTANNFATMRTVWNNQEVPEIRKNIADLVCKLLWDLNHTGERHPHFVAAYYNRPQPERQVELRIQTNTWGKCLRDSTLVATYAVVGDRCLKYSSTGNPGTPTSCRSEIPAARTALETAISCRGPSLMENDCVKIGEFEALFKVTRVESDNRHRRHIILVPTNATGRLHARAATEILRNIGRRNRNRTYCAIIRAQESSYGGMGEARHMQESRRQRQAIQVIKEGDPGCCDCCSCQ